MGETTFGTSLYPEEVSPKINWFQKLPHVGLDKSFHLSDLEYTAFGPGKPLSF